VNHITQPRPKPVTLLRLIGEWRALAGQQTEAIERSDWPGMARLSHAKERLKEAMDAAIVASRTDPRDEHPPGLRSAVEELVRLEQNNSQLLTERSRQIRGRLEQSRAGTRRLRLIGNAYRRTRQTPWHSYL
jgi:hypothetical protein